MQKFIERHFDLQGHQTTLKTEVIAGLTSFITVVYIIVVNGSILADAGIPYDAAIIATVLTSFVGCLLMGLRSNAPILLVPGMGLNVFFTFTIVHSMGLTWQEALAAVFISGLIFTLTAFTKLASLISQSIPSSLKEAITVGIGLLLTFIGLQKGSLINANSTNMVEIGNLGSPEALVTILTLVLAIVLFIRNVKGSLLLSILAGTVIAYLFGIVNLSEVKQTSFSIGDYTSVLGSMSFERIASLSFWIAIFSLTMVIVFENIGALYGMLQDQSKFKRAFQSNAISTITAGIFGTSPTVSTVESAAGIATGGKTGITAITAGILFLPALFLIPFMKLIPDSAIAPVLIIIGGLMIQNVNRIDFKDFSEGFPAFLIIALIPLTFSIADGIAFGFIIYPILKIALGRKKEVNIPLYTISLLFFLNLFVLPIITNN